MDWASICTCAVVGALGGFANGLIINSGLVAPRWIVRPHNKPVLELGTLASLLIGALSGLGAYWVLALDLAIRKDWGILFITGLGGDSFLSNLIQKREASTQSEIANQFQSIVKNEVVSDDRE
jgi:hypothetical protein